MSQYVTPFLVLNLGSEMVFVVAQRLQAQNIPAERAAFGTVYLETSTERHSFYFACRRREFRICTGTHRLISFFQDPRQFVYFGSRLVF